MKKYLFLAIVLSFITVDYAEARGGFSSSRSRGGFSSSRSYSAPKPSSSPRPSYSAPTKRVTTTINRYNSTPAPAPSFTPGFGSGIVTGMVLNHLMHPPGTVVYSGGGYNGSALLYPDGRVVNQQGYQVGNYTNGQFVPVSNGVMVAQPSTSVSEDTKWAHIGLVVVAIILIAVVIMRIIA